MTSLGTGLQKKIKNNVYREFDEFEKDVNSIHDQALK